MVATITISPEVIFVRERKKNAKKKSAAIVGPSSITPKLSVRYEFTPQRSSERRKPAISARGVSPVVCIGAAVSARGVEDAIISGAAAGASTAAAAVTS